jgi:HK97 family phage major capsid protein
MNEKKRNELKNQMETLKAEARQLVDENKMVEAKAKADEAKNLKEQIELMDGLDELEVKDGAGKPIEEVKDEADKEKKYNDAFFKAFKGKKLTAADYEIIDMQNSLTESTDADGALIVPKDVKTQINEYKRTLIDLSQLVTIEGVSTLSGSRVLEKLATMTAFENITDDTADIAEMASPQFETVTYAIKKYAGWLPIPNDLLKDTDQNITAYLSKWIGKKSIVTNNTLFLAILTALEEITFADYKAIKKALNISLDPMHSLNAKILTNQDGFQYFDTLEDGNGKPLLQVDITNPTKKLFAGKEIVVAPNSILATTGTTTKYAPIFVGDYKEGVVKFDRQTYEIASTNVGGTAFRKDRTEMRVIEREEYKAWDSAAIVRGKIEVTAVI